MHMQVHTFEGLGAFRDALPQLAGASSHPVYVDLGQSYGDADEPNQTERISHQAIWNDRDDRLAYVGTDAYEITQHADMLSYVDDAVGETVGEIDIGRIRDYGERIDGMVTLNGHNVDVADITDDGYVPPEGEIIDDRTASVEEAKQADGTVRDILGVGIRFHNSFDASERIRLQTMGYRYVCQNWMVWGEETIGEYTQLHIDELSREDVEDLIFDVMDTKEDRDILIRDAVEDDAPWNWIAPHLENVGFGQRYQKRIMQKLHDYGGVSSDTVRRWDLYNATTDVLDNTVVGDVNPNVYDRHQDKASELLSNEFSSPSETVPPEDVIGVQL